MKIIGVEFASNEMVWVIADTSGAEPLANGSGRIKLEKTKEPSALASFASSVDALLQKIGPNLIAIKDKPETGRMRAGAAALKMEAIFLVAAKVPVDFVSGHRINAAMETASGLKEKEKPAYRAAVAAWKKLA